MRLLSSRLKFHSIDKPRFSGSSKDKLMGQIGIVYGVLRRLGFREEVVLECLNNAAGIEIEQAFDWVRAGSKCNSFSL